ncbi:multicopper oxidase domain-containing protein [Nocardioides daeguensis]|uniref:Multicopper oxidase domain-containing protein n=1 Tax=Nocardioides daeguensis TaxID=908359 RepID=A0ABP6UQT5_9ACTN|nr:multicopper oxidase domain-containing protein [Nocardioides daeguensis]MBV6728262.1 multicopper oxidase domain-containing protein [Nocardioides daeguensis]MCR1773071.1 multicopper oxidase domain-containing protein [Nocardioides daeguensis]
MTSATRERGAAGGVSSGRGFWPLRDLPVLLWLFAAGVVALLHPFVPAPRWLMLHLLLLGALTHAILVWSRHFAEALLHLPPEGRAPQSRRLLLHNLGALAVITGVLTSAWSVTVAGAAAVATAVAWHGWDLGRQLRACLPARFAGTVRYYVAAACFLPVGATLGTALARDPADPWHTRILVAHVTVNLLGWVGLTVVGTLFTLWPTMLRTRMAPNAEAAARRALPVLACSVAFTAVAAALGLLPAAALGIAGYLSGLAVAASALVEPLRRKRPASFATWSIPAALAWLIGCLVVLAVGFATAATLADAARVFDWLVPFLAAGFGAQVLLGALSHLVPVALGGGPTPVRAAARVLDRAAPLRVVVTNAGLLLCAVPVPSTVRVLASMLVLASLGATPILLVAAVRTSRRAKAVPVAQRHVASEAPTRGRAAGFAGTGVAVVVLAVAAGVALDPAALSVGSSAAVGVQATGQTTTVEVVAQDMRFTPSTIRVPAGDRLVLVVTNADEDVHDLALDTGDRTERLSPGETERLDVGVVGRDVEGWCTVVGHRQMGMVLHIDVTGPASTATQVTEDHSQHSHGPSGSHDSTATETDRAEPADGSEDAAGAADSLSFLAAPPDGFQARDAALPPLDRPRVHRRTITVRDEIREVAPGITQRQWTYDGTAPGPVLHGRVGDRFVITLVNGGSIGHSIDFHAGALAPQQPMRTIAPGESLVYRFRATRAGIWMYHCSTMPMSAHIANGLFGAVVIEPRGLPPVDRSYVLVQSELYLGAQAGETDAAKVAADAPDAVVFNGYANQYDHRPLPARVGERVRVWVLDAGPNRSTSFHVVGGQFDTAWAEGAYLLDRRDHGGGGAQSLSLGPSQGGFVELTFPEAGSYPFVTHVMVDAERGAHGAFQVTPGVTR